MADIVFVYRDCAPKSPLHGESNRRNAGRICVSDDVQSSLGTVVDISATGMRVLSRKPQCGSAEVTLNAPDITLTLQAEIVWSRRAGFRQHLLGVRFLTVDAPSAAILTRIASENRLVRAA